MTCLSMPYFYMFVILQFPGVAPHVTASPGVVIMSVVSNTSSSRTSRYST